MILLAQDLRVHGGGGEKRTGGRHAVADHQFDLLVVGAVREYTDVTTAADDDASLHRELERFLRREHLLGWRVARLPVLEVPGRGDDGLERRQVSDVMLRHHL